MDNTVYSATGLLDLAPEGEGGRAGVARALVGHGCRVVMFRFAAGAVANVDTRVRHEVRAVDDAVFQLVMLDPAARPQGHA